MGIIGILAAGLLALAQQAGQGIQQWITSPHGQQAIQNLIQQFGPDVIREVCKKLGINL